MYTRFSWLLVAKVGIVGFLLIPVSIIFVWKLNLDIFAYYFGLLYYQKYIILRFKNLYHFYKYHIYVTYWKCK